MGKPSRPALSYLFAILSLALLLPAQRGDLVLSGQVQDPSGKAIPFAEVFAQPNKIRSGETQGFCLYGYHDLAIGWYCPVCVGDLGVRARADVEGQFTIPGLPREFAHYVVASAPGFTSDWVGPVYPEKGPIEIELLPSTSERKVYRGRVLAAGGEPSARASVMVAARTSGVDETTWSRKGLDRLVSTDEAGRFAIACAPDFDRLHLRIKAEGQAVLMANLYASDASEGEQVFRMPVGVVVRGRLFKGVDPLPLVEMRLVQADRYPTRFHGPISTRVDKDGSYSFSAVTPGIEYRLFATTESMLGRGALRYVKLSVPIHEETLHVDHLYAKPGHRLRGKLVTSDDSNLPKGIRILATRPETWDFIPVDVDEDGAFEVADLPSEILSLAFTVPGYHLSDDNPNRDPIEPARLLGRIDESLDEFVVLLAPGEAPEKASTPALVIPTLLTSAR